MEVEQPACPEVINISLVSTKSFSLMQNHYFTDSIKEFWKKNRATIIDRLCAKDSVVALGKYGTLLCKTSATFLLTFPEKRLFPRYCKLLLYSTYVWVTYVYVSRVRLKSQI